MDVWGSPYLAAQAAYLRHLADVPGSEVLADDGVWAVRTGVVSNTENGALSSGGSRISAAVARAVVEWLSEVPASWLCSEGPGLAETAAALTAAGCEPEGAAWEMSARLDALDLDRETPATAVERVRSAAELASWLDVAGTCGWFETGDEREQLRRRHVGDALAGDSRLRLYLAREDGKAIGMAAAFRSDEAVMLTASAVLEPHRRRGIGSALALTRLREARAEGCELAVLAPSPDGAMLYRSLGFATHPQPPDRWFYVRPT